MLKGAGVPSLSISSDQLSELLSVQRGILDALVQVKAQIDGFTIGVKFKELDETAVLVQFVP